MIPGIGQFLASLLERPGKFLAARRGLAQQRSREGAKCRRHRVHKDETIAGQQSLHQPLERGAIADPRRVGLFHEADNSSAYNNPAIASFNAPTEGIDLDRAHRRPRSRPLPSRQTELAPPSAIDVAVVHFLQIVVLGRQPEDRDRADAAVVELAGQLRRRQRLVDGVCRPAKQTHLLAGDHGHRVRQFEQSERGDSPLVSLSAAASAQRRSWRDLDRRGRVPRWPPDRGDRAGRSAQPAQSGRDSRRRVDWFRAVLCGGYRSFSCSAWAPGLGHNRAYQSPAPAAPTIIIMRATLI